MNRNLIDLARQIASAASMIAASTEGRHATDIAARARNIEQEAKRLAAELRVCCEPNPIREVPRTGRELFEAKREAERTERDTRPPERPEHASAPIGRVMEEATPDE